MKAYLPKWLLSGGRDEALPHKLVLQWHWALPPAGTDLRSTNLHESQDRVECRGLRPGTLPHHRTCGFPHPAVELSSSSLQDLMASGSQFAEGPRWSAQTTSLALPRYATRPVRWRQLLAVAPLRPVHAASAHVPSCYATATRKASGCAVVSIPPAGRLRPDPRPVGSIPTSLECTAASRLSALCWFDSGFRAASPVPLL
jgi:hypothetical protein